ncbi:heavy-metal-associated domain-containing protein [Microbacterium sp.]|uniref:heavy-metal-associated domain-containing protein n=1 Tax=Microbacterium sp. TaxID=51671 RepID=UPI00281163DD|nr:heavy-metal-associated domain-containing protein [Microbacterium sp.]
MNTAARLSLFGAGVVVAFGAAFGLAGAIVPAELVAGWQEKSEMNEHDTHDEPSATAAPKNDDHGGHTGHTAAHTTPQGLSLSENGYVLSPVQAPTAVGADGELSFQILDDSGEPVVDYTTEHDKDLHLIVVRSDGTGFRHVHPQLDAGTGVWSLPWRWQDAGTYRVFADFAPQGADGITLTRTVHVGGEWAPVASSASKTDEVDGFTVTLDGELTAGAPSELTLSIARDGQPVTDLEPYLGAFGHLVALREGDLAYLHVHPEGPSPESAAHDDSGDHEHSAVTAHGGPDIGFVAEAPTPGRYLLYLDFQVDGTVHTATFVVDAASAQHGAHDDSH